MWGQGKLTEFGFKGPLYHPIVHPKGPSQPQASTSFIQTMLDPPSEAPSAQSINNLTASPSTLSTNLHLSSTCRVRSSSVLSDPSTDSEERQDQYKEDAMETETGMVNDVEEDELDEQAQGPVEHIRDWADLSQEAQKGFLN